ncbi:uncharacterized protein EHS24_002266 [Apiotrichum porosum]|uniref:Cytochrome b561 domain-containing protein n=1 Tax=Apiotrichum porosum TaxID=105984 RepID=A0A427XI37_9TREE|nr:uncharacterized protein EHS24_002266 [Apiotrichum porosum]RSH78540.1 hypothetical protein EHS24_002266 [Apiotrichum porosum]
MPKAASRRRSRSSLERPLLSDTDGLRSEAAELSPRPDHPELHDPRDSNDYIGAYSEDIDHDENGNGNDSGDDDEYAHDYEHRTRRRVSFLDMVPSRRDKVSLGLIVIGLALFLPLTWALVLTANVRALGWFAPHPPLNALAITAFVLGIMPVQPPTPPAGIRAARLGVHQRVLLGIALPAMTIGTSCMYWNKHIHGAAHITTWHARFGIATFCWMWLQAAFGAASAWKGGAAFGGGMKAKAMYKYHRASGYALVALSLLTAVLAGGYSTWAISRGEQFVPLRIVAFGVGIPLVFVGLAMRVRPSKMKFT